MPDQDGFGFSTNLTSDSVGERSFLGDSVSERAPNGHSWTAGEIP
jgi:hypothetical protein